MCCMLTTLFLFGPRLAILFWWLINPVRFNLAFNEAWVLTILAWLFLPWTVLMYLIIFQGGIVGFDWVILILGLLADIASYTGGFWSNRNQIPGYE
ncbi:MAG: hypothetical protein U9R58_09650 [Chloroflexota bacterium]|nr:hypothetical protein [Chloroflexota bacterium]